MKDLSGVIQAAVVALSDDPYRRGAYAPMPARKPIPAARGVGRAKMQQQQTGQDSIQSPFTETSRVEGMQTIALPVGTISVDIQYPQTIAITDGGGRPFVFNYRL